MEKVIAELNKYVENYEEERSYKPRNKTYESIRGEEDNAKLNIIGELSKNVPYFIYYGQSYMPSVIQTLTTIKKNKLEEMNFETKKIVRDSLEKTIKDLPEIDSIMENISLFRDVQDNSLRLSLMTKEPMRAKNFAFYSKEDKKVANGGLKNVLIKIVEYELNYSETGKNKEELKEEVILEVAKLYFSLNLTHSFKLQMYLSTEIFLDRYLSDENTKKLKTMAKEWYVRNKYSSVEDSLKVSIDTNTIEGFRNSCDWYYLSNDEELKKTYKETLIKLLQTELDTNLKAKNKNNYEAAKNYLNIIKKL